MVVADADKQYNEAFVNYILNNCSNRFLITTFFNKDNLYNDLTKKSNNKIDILLVAEDIYEEDLTKFDVDVIIILTKNKNCSYSDLNYINKYQRIDILLNNVLNIYSEKNQNFTYNMVGNNETKIVAVYSPVGGIGKTTLSVGCGIQSALNGKSVLYVNFEDIQSTECFFECKGDKNLSNLLYYVKAKRQSFALKCEEVIKLDNDSNVHYFLPPDNINDMNELTVEEVNFIFEELRRMKKYDYVFVDMSTSMNDKNIEILDIADFILLLFGQDEMSLIKAKQFINQIDLIGQIRNNDISKKIQIIINKYDNKIYTSIDFINMHSNKRIIRIPYANNLVFKYKNRYKIDMNDFLVKGINKILNSIN